MKKAIFLLFCLTVAVLNGQNLLDWPESAVYDTIGGQYLVSNWGDGAIIAIDDDGNQSYFNQDLNSVAGIRIIGNKLFCCDRQGIGIIDIVSGELDTLISVEGDSLLNDLDYDSNGNLYISDYWDPKIYKMNLQDYSYEVWVEYGGQAPNGVIMDEDNGRLIILTGNSFNSFIKAVDLETAETTTLADPVIRALDGIVRDRAGSYYVSEWQSHTVTRFNSQFDVPGVAVSTGHNGPADIYYNPLNDVLAIPSLNSNSVEFTQLIIMGIEEGNQFMLPKDRDISVHNYPNPFNPVTTFYYSIPGNISNAKLEIFDARGRLVATLPCNASGITTWDAAGNASGVYYYQARCGGNVFGRGKALLLK